MDAIRKYVKGAFEGVEPTPDVLEQQEEIVADIGAKVDDLVAGGRSEEEALGMALASFGDLTALAGEFKNAEARGAAVQSPPRAGFPRWAKVTLAIALGLLILWVAMGVIGLVLFSMPVHQVITEVRP